MLTLTLLTRTGSRGLRWIRGRDLVGYEIVENGVTRFGGRVIEIDPPARRRITR